MKPETRNQKPETAEGKRQKAEVDCDAASSRVVFLLVSGFWFLVFPAVAAACPVCYGQPGSAVTDGARNGVLFLLGVIGSVQIGFVALFVSFWKRAKAAKEKREQEEEAGMGRGVSS